MLSYSVHAPSRGPTRGGSCFPTVNWDRLAFFTCPRGKSQRTGKQICCFTFFPSSFVALLIFRLHEYIFGLHVFYVSPHLLLSPYCLPSTVHFVLCQIRVIIHSYMIRQPNTEHKTDNSDGSGFELHGLSLSQGCQPQAERWWIVEAGDGTRLGEIKEGGADRRGIAKWKLMNEIWYTMSGADTTLVVPLGWPGLPSMHQVFNLIYVHVLHT